MKCPNCPDVTLSLSERQGVELDYCPQCRGVWLDRGELDKLIERSGKGRYREESDDDNTQAGRHHSPQQGDYAPRRAHDRHGGYERRRKSWFGELFD
jgi:Zn-finger nucleic acid-binding protein